MGSRRPDLELPGTEDVLAEWRLTPWGSGHSKLDDYELAAAISNHYENLTTARLPREPRLVLAPNFKLKKIDRERSVRLPALWVEWEDVNPDLTRPEAPDIWGLALVHEVRGFLRGGLKPALPVRG